MLRDGAKPDFVVYSTTELVVPLYRVVGQEVPTNDDFQSYLMAGRPFPLHLYFRATGVSMFIKRAEADKLARGRTLGSFVARLSLSDRRIAFALTNETTGHVCVWGMPSLLRGAVISCEKVGTT